jgi:hypothetical protein
MGVKLVSSSGGSVEVNPPTTASNFTQTLVATTGTLAPIVSGTAVASTSGTSIDFTGIPSWAKRITVMLSGVSTNGSSLLLVRVGTSSGIVSTGYDSTANAGIIGGQYQNITNAFCITYNAAATSKFKGAIVLTNISGNTWVQTGTTSDSVVNAVTTNSSGDVTLSGTLDRVRITTVNGTDTFDAGTINILYE